MKKLIIISLTLIFMSNIIQAKGLSGAYKERAHKYWSIFKKVGVKYGVEPEILLAIAIHESALRPYAINRANRNKTIDVGIMQINSWWFPTLRKYTGDLNDLKDPEFNIAIGAWIFSQCTRRFGVSWKAIDCYNKGENKAQNNSRYIRGVNKKYRMVKSESSLR